MSYNANQYNHATPLSSATGLTSIEPHVADVKYFTLHDNALDGSYVPISGDVGLWGDALSDSNGVLPVPFVVTITESLSVSTLRITGSQQSYPVDFTVQFYNGATLLYTITEVGHNSADYMRHLDKTYDVTSYTITVTKISRANAVARLYNVSNPVHMRRIDNLHVFAMEERKIFATDWSSLKRTDHVVLKCRESSHIRNTIDRTYDTLSFKPADVLGITNVHTRMKDPSRRIYGKVYVTYTDPMLDNEINVESNMSAYNDSPVQVTDGVTTSDGLHFTLYDNDLSGKYKVMSEASQVGWVSGAVSDAYGNFAEAPYVRINFSARPVRPLAIHFDDSHGCVAEDFTVTFVKENDVPTVKSIAGNTSAHVQVIDEILADVISVTVTVTKVTKPYMPVAILDIPVLSVFLYTGYQDESKLMSIDLLEELTYDDDIEALGGMSANEVTVVIDNSDRSFYLNSNSVISQQLKRNRKIEPWLGVEVVPGQIEWYKQGTFWSYRWNVPVKGLTATVVGFDTIGLLGTTDFTHHQTLVDKSLGELIEYVLTDAKSMLSFLSWRIDEALYDVVIPYAWFANGSHAAALRKISQSYPMHIYCDKEGTICAAPQKLRLDHYNDVWSDSTNVIHKDYNSLYTTVPNSVTVNVKIPHEEANSTLITDNLIFDVADVPTRTLNFSKPYLSNLVVTVDADETVTYDYEVYSWGIEITFSGSGQVRAISCTGTALDISNTSVITRKDAASIRINGAVTRDVSADFIQTASLATLIINRLFELAEYDKYDANVTYRGDIALSINDPILLLDGIAPDTRYNIRRHKLLWNGALSGTADLNT